MTGTQQEFKPVYKAVITGTGNNIVRIALPEGISVCAKFENEGTKRYISNYWTEQTGGSLIGEDVFLSPSGQITTVIERPSGKKLYPAESVTVTVPASYPATHPSSWVNRFIRKFNDLKVEEKAFIVSKAKASLTTPPSTLVEGVDLANLTDFQKKLQEFFVTSSGCTGYEKLKPIIGSLVKETFDLSYDPCTVLSAAAGTFEVNKLYWAIQNTDSHNYRPNIKPFLCLNASSTTTMSSTVVAVTRQAMKPNGKKGNTIRWADVRPATEIEAIAYFTRRLM